MNRYATSLLMTLGALAASRSSAADNSPASPTFNANIRPIFQAYCTECHGEAAKPKGGLDLRLRRLVLKGGDSGPAIVPGDPEKSLLLTAVHQTGDLKMPPKGAKLSADEIKSMADYLGDALGTNAKPIAPAK